jgi:predicted dehydrogenase
MVRGKLGVGVIGTGAFGSQHAQVYSQSDLCALQAVADINPQRLSEISSALHVQGYGDYRDLLGRDDIQAVSVCTTDDLHVDVAVAAAHAGKHVLVEKPLAMTPEDCERIIKACQASGVILMVGHILRFDPRYLAAYAEIREERIGKLVHLFARRNNLVRNARRLAKHTSVLFFLGIHDLDMINWCVGARPEHVYAEATSTKLGNTPDTVLALLRFPGGVLASLEVSWILTDSYPGRLDARFEAMGTDGSVQVNGGSETVMIVHAPSVPPQVECPELFYAPEVHGQRVGILRDEVHHFLRCIVEGRTPIVGGQEGKAAVEVACAIQRSLDTGKVVELS